MKTKPIIKKINDAQYAEIPHFIERSIAGCTNQPLDAEIRQAVADIRRAMSVPDSPTIILDSPLAVALIIAVPSSSLAVNRIIALPLESVDTITESPLSASYVRLGFLFG